MLTPIKRERKLRVPFLGGTGAKVHGVRGGRPAGGSLLVSGRALAGEKRWPCAVAIWPFGIERTEFGAVLTAITREPTPRVPVLNLAWEQRRRI